MVTQSDVLEFIRNIIEEVKDFDGEVGFQTTLEELSLDSLDYVQTQIEAKKLFGVDLSGELFVSGQIKTVGELCAYVAEQAASRAESAPAGEEKAAI